MFLTERGYYIISIIIIFVAILGFLWSFERRKPREREVVVLAVVTGMAVVGRMIFFMTPQFKPCAAIIIITGIMLGKQAGFLSGALTAFVSDFFFGQGPWTPWQMIAFGIIGFLTAVFFSGWKETLKHHRVVLCIVGFLMTFLLYGFIMDTATVFMYTDEPTIEAFLATYISGIVFNLVHGISTVVFLWLLAKPMIQKLERMKIKYGIYN